MPLYSRWAMARQEEPRAVGEHIRRRVIPVGMTVTEAAKRLGVSRVALSNLLNDRASLSQQMALRLKTAFGADPEEIFRVQAESQSGRRREEERAMAVRTYVPPFLTIKASQIDAWADQSEEARSRLPVLVRRLIRSTGRDLRQLDFPGYGEGQRPGWDGRVETGATTPWIPAGDSGWELSTSREPARKADSDFKNRLVLPAEEREETTFVFVSSRCWPKKNQWAEQRRAEGRWKDVRALDANDLEQWLEASIEGQIWLAEQLNLPSLEDCVTLDRAWERWAEVSAPPMPEDIFRPSVAGHLEKLTTWLKVANPERPFTLAADSKDEALAFLACLSREEQIPEEFRDRAVVINSAKTLRTLAQSTSSFIPIVGDEETEGELAHWRHHSIVWRPRNAVGEPDMSLGPLGYEAFEKSLTAMGFERRDIHRLARESGRSPTILRRRLSENDAIKRPRWARKSEIARKLVPMALVGAWKADSRADSKADREVLSTLSNRPFSEFDEDVVDLLRLEDSPVWLVGRHGGVVSQIDALFAVGLYVTTADLDLFFDRAEFVLSEPDPALELASGERWAAAVHGKVRRHSDSLRAGVCETLVLLAVHGNTLFRGGLGIDLEARVGDLVGRLLTPEGGGAPLSAETLMSYDRDLPRLAEAAPDQFLRLLEADLLRGDSALFELLEPVAPSIFAGCPRTGLLWALECLAWNPSNLPRVALILGQLSTKPIDDNWVNRPINSLEAIFRSWMPQTAASPSARFQALELLCSRIPEVGWQICMEQLRRGPRTGTYSQQPRWRGDAADAGDPVSHDDRREFDRRTLELALEWPRPRDADKLGDLIDLLSDMSDENQGRVWALIEEWLKREPGEEQKAVLRERLRRFGYTSVRPAFAVEPALTARAQALYDRLAPEDPASRHAWLFADHWIHEWPEDFDDAMDFSEREERIRNRRTEAMTEIWSTEGLRGALSLLPSSNAADTVGIFASRCVPGQHARAEVLRACLSGDLPAELELDEAKVDGFLGGFIGAVGEDSREELLRGLAEELPREQIARLLLCAPFGRQTWGILEQQERDVRERYWREVSPLPGTGVTADEVTALTDRLLDAGRPRAAFNALHLAWDGVETSRLRRLLNGIVAGSPEPDGSIKLGAYDVCRAIESLSKRAGVARDEMADLEFVCSDLLEFDDYGVPNLERRIAEDPSYFVWLVALVYKRKDGRVDPDGWPVSNPKNKAYFGKLAFSVLLKVARIPGTEAGESEIDAKALRGWVSEVRRQSTECGRVEAADICIGQLFAQKPPENGSSWPSRPICEAMEAVATESIASGFYSGVADSRGAVMRAEGGGQERELAAKYRAWAEPLYFEFPFVASQVLERIAKSYDQEAAYWDSEAELEKRLED